MGGMCTRIGQKESELKMLMTVMNHAVFDDETHFTKTELERLFNQFWAMAYKEGTTYNEYRMPVLSYEDLLKYTDSRNPLHERIILAFMASKPRDQMQLARMDLKTFVKRMSLFTRTAPLQDKLKFMFRVYDTYNNEVINASDVKALLVELHGDEMTEYQRDSMAREFLKEFGDETAVEITRDMFVKNCGEGTTLDDMVVRFA